MSNTGFAQSQENSTNIVLGEPGLDSIKFQGNWFTASL